MSLSRRVVLRNAAPLFPVSVSFYNANSCSPFTTLLCSSLRNVERLRFSAFLMHDSSISNCISPKSSNSTDISSFKTTNVPHDKFVQCESEVCVSRQCILSVPFTSVPFMLTNMIMIHGFFRSSILLPVRFKHTFLQVLPKKAPTKSRKSTLNVWYRLVDKNGQYIGNPSIVLVTPGDDLNDVLKKVKRVRIEDIPPTLDDSELNVYGSSEIVTDVSTLLKGEQIDVGMEVIDLLKSSIGVSSKNPLIIQVLISSPVKTETDMQDASLISSFIKSTSRSAKAEIMDRLCGRKKDAILVYKPQQFAPDCDVAYLKDREESLLCSYRLLTLHIALRDFAGVACNDRLYNPLYALQGAPGTGKSTFLDLIIKGQYYKTLKFNDLEWKDVFDIYFALTKLQREELVNIPPIFEKSFEKLKEFLDEMIYIPITFNSACELQFDEVDIDIACQSRVYYSFFSSIEGFGNKMHFDTWQKIFYNAAKGQSLSVVKEAIDFIRYYYATRISKLNENDTPNVPVLLLVDEIVKLSKIDVRNNLERGVTAFTSALRLKNVFLLMTTLNMSKLYRVSSGRLIFSVPLPLLKFNSALELFSPTHRDNYNYQFGIAACAGHPRSIAYFLQYLNSADIKRSNLPITPSKSVNVKHFVESNMFVATKLQRLTEPMVKAALLGVTCSDDKIIDNNVSFDELVQAGNFINSSVNGIKQAIPTVAPWQLLAFCTYLTSDHVVKSLMNAVAVNKRDFDFRDYELFHAHWEVVARWAGRLTIEGMVPDGNGTVPLLGLYFLDEYEKLPVKVAKSVKTETANISMSNISMSKWYISSADETNSWQKIGPRINAASQKKGVIITSSVQFGQENHIYDENGKQLTLEDLENNIIVSGFKNNAGADSYSIEKIGNGKYIFYGHEFKLSNPDSIEKYELGPTELLKKYEKFMQYMEPHLLGGKMQEKSLLGQLKLTRDSVFLFGTAMGKDAQNYVVEYEGLKTIFCLNRPTLLQAYSPTLAQLPCFMWDSKVKKQVE